ncbi:MAG: serine hydrolase domain-containing protein [bacterium]
MKPTMRPLAPSPGDVPRRPLRILTLIAALLPLAAEAHGQPRADLAARVDSLFAEWDRPGSPGCALGVVQDGRLVYARGYGYANLDHDVPISPKTVFYIASVSKQFTAASIVLLAQQGALSLDDDVRTYIPELPDYGAPITIRHLIHHTSGLRDYLTLMLLAGMRLEDVHTDEEVLDLVTRQEALNFTPGERHLYSNTGYLLMAEIVRRVSGKSLREFADEHIFRPLGMTSTHFHDDRTMVVRNRAMAYARNEDGSYRLDMWTNFDKVGSGGLLSSVEDLALWDLNAEHHTVGGAALREQMLERGVLNNGDTLDYAFGLVLGEYRGLRTVSHSGGSMGFRAHHLRFPDERFAVICLCNLGSIDAAGLARRVADIYLEDRFPEPPQATRASGPAPRAGDAASPFPAPAEAALAEFAGRYHSDELRVTYTLAVERGRLVLHGRNAPPATLQAIGPDRFRADGVALRFVRHDSRNITGFVLDAGRVLGLRFQRVPE